MVNPEDGGNMFSKMSVPTMAIWYKVPKDIYNRYHLESIPKDSVLQPYIVSLYGEANQQ
jgi:hypothetical protein